MNRTVTPRPYVGLKPEDIDRYSVMRAFRSQLSGGLLDGLEREVHDELNHLMPNKAEGVWLPSDVLFARGRRDLSVGSWPQGGALVATEVATQVIELLRNKSICFRLGAVYLDGLQGNLAIPRQTGATTVQAVPEGGQLQSSDPTVDQVALTPHRIGVTTTYTRQLLLQSSPSVEAWLREDLVAQLALKWDLMMLSGSGANDEPLGILNTPGIGSIAFEGPATYAKVVAFETSLAVMNADVGTLCYATTPAVKAAWKLIARVLTGATVLTSEPLWQNWPDKSGDGLVNGYRAAATGQILNDGVLFAHFADLVFGVWGAGTDWIVNPYSRDTEGKIRVTGNSYVDVALRHAESFCWSADPGNQ
jgi:HK97 family phage major capsid protein